MPVRTNFQVQLKSISETLEFTQKNKKKILATIFL